MRPRYVNGPVKRSLRALLFNHELGLVGGGFFFAVGAGDVTEGRGRRVGRVEVGKWALTVGNRVVSAADDRYLGGHGMGLGMEWVAGRFNDLRLVGEHGDSDLSESGGGAENDEGQEFDFHRFGSEFREDGATAIPS